jgi:hypothetical protein
MKLLVMCFGDKLHGYGHVYRCEALIDTANELNHNACMLGNRRASFLMHNARDMTNYLSALYDFKPDWVVIDLEEQAPDWMSNYAHQFGAKVAYLNGVGRVEENYGADCTWVQDSPDTVILRQSVIHSQLVADPECSPRWFVFGGSADPLDLLPTFARNMQEKSWLISTELSASRDVIANTEIHQITLVSDERILYYMARADKMCTHMGMINWEGAYLGLPIYTFSRGAGHLGFAKRMEGMGLVCAFPRVGIPDKSEFVEFLEQPFIPDGEKPDGKGAERFLETISTY